MNFSSLQTPNGLLVFVNGQRFTVATDHVNYAKIMEAIRNKAYATIPGLANVATVVRKWLDTDKQFSLVSDLISYEDRTFSAAVTDKVLRMIDSGQPADSLFNFLRKVRRNPSSIAQDELLLFCVANEFMIHEDGDIIAYKSVRDDYMDIHSGTVRNAIGDRPSMDRGQVDDRRENTCSRGYHFAAFKYATSWHGRSDARLMIMKINPADVVSIPSDYNNQKARCSTYEVIAEIPHGNSLPQKEVYREHDFERKCSCSDCEPDFLSDVEYRGAAAGVLTRYNIYRYNSTTRQVEWRAGEIIDSQWNAHITGRVYEPDRVIIEGLENLRKEDLCGECDVEYEPDVEYEGHDYGLARNIYRYNSTTRQVEWRAGESSLSSWVVQTEVDKTDKDYDIVSGLMDLADNDMADDLFDDDDDFDDDWEDEFESDDDDDDDDLPDDTQKHGYWL